jgi:F-type H+-transporting ATPase subunit b
MELVSPGIGLFIWMTLAFGLVLFILGKYAWKPILKALKEREESIEDALHAADKAREEMKMLQVDNEKLLREGREERDALLTEARKLREGIIEEAREKATAETERILAAARDNIHYEKMLAITDLKNQLAQLSIEIAEKLLKEKLKEDGKQQEIIERLIREAKFN